MPLRPKFKHQNLERETDHDSLDFVIKPPSFDDVFYQNEEELTPTHPTSSSTTSTTLPESTSVTAQPESVSSTPPLESGVSAILARLGRNTVVKPSVEVKPVPEPNSKDAEEPDIVLDYYDDDGNLLSPRSAYKHLSHKFSNRYPGPKRREREAKKKKEENTVTKRLQEQANMDVVKNLLKQKKTSEIVLDGGGSLQKYGAKVDQFEVRPAFVPPKKKKEKVTFLP
ncbi:hypothetical protein GEMRC1_003049 [Eukaryota sp. GEM-RC1]